MKLYYAPKTSAFVPHLVLEEAGADFELLVLDLKRGEQRSDRMLEINPLGRVPVLVTADGTLSEVPAILTYIAGLYPSANLEPAELFAKAELASFNAFLSSSVHVAIAHFGRAQRWADDPAACEAMRAKAPSVYAGLFEIIDWKLENGPWVCGAQFTTADPYVFYFARLLDLVQLDRRNYPSVERHYDRMLSRPSVEGALAKERELIAAQAGA